MELIILAGGLGTRIRQALPNIPKAMAPINGVPFAEILVRYFVGKGITRIIFALGYRAELIEAHFRGCFKNIAIEYVVEPHPLGTGGAVRLAMTKCLNDYTMVINGDTFLDFDLAQAFAKWHEYRSPVMVLRKIEDAGRYGGVLVERGIVTRFIEKENTGASWINGGCYIFPTTEFNRWKLNEPFSLEKDYLQKVVPSRPIYAYKTSGLFIDIGVPDDLKKAQHVLGGVLDPLL